MASASSEKEKSSAAGSAMCFLPTYPSTVVVFYPVLCLAWCGVLSLLYPIVRSIKINHVVVSSPSRNRELLVAFSPTFCLESKQAYTPFPKQGGSPSSPSRSPHSISSPILIQPPASLLEASPRKHRRQPHYRLILQIAITQSPARASPPLPQQQRTSSRLRRRRRQEPDGAFEEPFRAGGRWREESDRGAESTFVQGVEHGWGLKCGFCVCASKDNAPRSRGCGRQLRQNSCGA